MKNDFAAEERRLNNELEAICEGSLDDALHDYARDSRNKCQRMTAPAL